MMARYDKYPESKEKGIQGLPRLVIFASEQVSVVKEWEKEREEEGEEEEEEECSTCYIPIQSHYSVKKSSIIMGLGTDNVISVKCDERSLTYYLLAHLTHSLPSFAEQGWTPLIWRGRSRKAKRRLA